MWYNRVCKYYVTLDSRYSDEISSDGTKLTFYLSKLLIEKKLENVISFKLYSFQITDLTLDLPDYCKITINFDEIVESFKHQTRKFHFMGESSYEPSYVHNYGTAWYFNLTGYNIIHKDPYGFGEFKLNNPIRFLDKLTMSIADPIECIPYSLLPKGFNINLEFTCFEKVKIDHEVAILDSTAKKINAKITINNNIFYRYQGKRVYLSLNTAFADTISFGLAKWALNDFNVITPGYAAVSYPIKNVLAVSMKPLYLPSVSPDPQPDYFLINIDEIGNGYFKNAVDVKYQFVLEKQIMQYRNIWGSLDGTTNYKYITTGRCDLTPYNCNDGWIYLNKPTPHITTITLKSHQRVVVSGAVIYKPVSILNITYVIRGLSSSSNGVNGLSIYVASSEDQIGTEGIGGTLYISGFEDNTLPATTVTELNRPQGFTIVAFLMGGWRLDFDLAASLGYPLMYNQYNVGNSPYQPGLVYFKTTPTTVNFEFICGGD